MVLKDYESQKLLKAIEACNIIEQLAEAGTGVGDKVQPTHRLFKVIKAHAQICADRIEKLHTELMEQLRTMEKAQGEMLKIKATYTLEKPSDAGSQDDS